VPATKLAANFRPHDFSWCVIAAVSGAVGILIGAGMLYIGFQVNPQGEFFDPATGDVDFPYAILLFFAWFAAMGFPASL
jgi:hypothetical protein